MRSRKPTSVRLAEHGGSAIFAVTWQLKNWEVVEITPDGWKNCRRCTCQVSAAQRGLLSLPIPMPNRGSKLDDLRKLLNVENESAWILMKAWLAGTLAAR